MPNLLIEIGTEELPLSALDVIYRELEGKTRNVLETNRIACGKIQFEATPRRIALFVENIAQRQANTVLEISGPKWEQAFDEKNTPSKALLGFLKAKGAALKDVTDKETPKGKFVLVKKLEKGKSVQAVLPELLESLFTGLGFPKMMRWEATRFRFPRPIRWIVALMDNKVVSFKLADIKSSNVSYGHRFLSPKAFKVLKADWKAYQKRLQKAHVILSLKKREALVKKTLQTRFAQKKIDEELVHIASQIVEEPFFLEGSFGKEYLKLPAEVLATCMKKNQKIFACYSVSGKLLNHFVAVLNGKRSGLARIRFDYENVLDSRLKDARYFFESDTKEPLESKLPLLEQITYLGKLGTMRDKTKRLEKLASEFAQMTNSEDCKENLKRVCALAKIDLMTQLVFEFTELQGIIGREYAIEGGEKKEVALAIGTQYLPANLSEDYKKLPKNISKLGALYGVLDRLDLLVGAFGTGIEPTGSQDPFALRRAAGVMVKLIRAFDLRFSLSYAFKRVTSVYGDVLDKDPTERLFSFLADRVAFELQVKPGSREMEIFQAVWRASPDDLGDAFERYEVLISLAKKEKIKFQQAAKVVERTGNIIKNSTLQTDELNGDILTEPLEKKLYELLESKSGEIERLTGDGNYAKATLRFGEVFYGPIHEFFEQVMVNVEDTAIRQNRQVMMKKINDLYAKRIADLSVLSRLDE